MNEILIVGLGPGSPDYLTRAAEAALTAADVVLVDNLMHPVSRWLSQNQIVTEINVGIANQTIEDARQRGALFVVGVTGNPTTSNPLVKAIVSLGPQLGTGVRILPGLTGVDVAAAASTKPEVPDSLQVVRIVPGASASPDLAFPFRGVYRAVDPTRPVVIELQAGCRTDTPEMQQILEPFPFDHPVTSIGFDASGQLQTERITVGSLANVTTIQGARALIVEPIGRLSDRAAFDTLRYIVARLRAPDGCPWDREQDYASIKKHLIEETYEAVGALDERDYEKFAEELGDVLLQVVMYGQLGREAGDFTLEDILRSVNDKLVRRHPHVFGDVEVKDSAEVLKNWEKIKRTEQATKPSTFGGVPEAAPALMRAEAIQSRAERYGWERPTVFRSIDLIDAAGTDRNGQLAALGSILFDLVSVARRQHLDPEEALRVATNQFRRSFDRILAEQQDRGVNFDALPPDERRRILSAASTEPSAGQAS